MDSAYRYSKNQSQYRFKNSFQKDESVIPRNERGDKINAIYRDQTESLSKKRKIDDRRSIKRDYKNFTQNKVDTYYRDTTEIKQLKTKSFVEINELIIAACSVGEIINICNDNISKFSYVNVATAAHRIGTLSKQTGLTSRQEHFMEYFVEQVFLNLESMKPREIANIVWAYAIVGVKSQALFDAIASYSIDMKQSFISQEIANLLWAFAKLGIQSKELFSAFASVSINKMDDFNSQDIANILWAYATLRIDDKELFNSTACSIINKMRNFNTQEIANTLWAFATFGIQNKELFDVMALVAIKKIQFVKPQEIAIILWAFATLGFHNEELFNALAFAAIDKMQKFNSQDIANTIFAFATLDIQNTKLFNAIDSAIIKEKHNFNTQELANTLWAFATLNRLSPKTLSNLLLCVRCNDLPTEAISQLLQVYLFVQHVQKSEIKWPDALIRSFESFVPKSDSSKLHLDVIKHLINCQINYESEKLINGLSVDIMIPDKKIIIEVDGPFHFAYNSKRELGATVFKRTLLLAMGWKVINIPYWVWYNLEGREKKCEYLKKSIEEVSESKVTINPEIFKDDGIIFL